MKLNNVLKYYFPVFITLYAYLYKNPTCLSACQGCTSFSKCIFLSQGKPYLKFYLITFFHSLCCLFVFSGCPLFFIYFSTYDPTKYIELLHLNYYLFIIQLFVQSQLFIYFSNALIIPFGYGFYSCDEVTSKRQKISYILVSYL